MSQRPDYFSPELVVQIYLSLYPFFSFLVLGNIACLCFLGGSRLLGNLRRKVEKLEKLLEFRIVRISSSEYFACHNDQITLVRNS